MTAYRGVVADLDTALTVPVVTPRDPVRPPAVIVSPGTPWLEPYTGCAPIERYELLVIAGTVDRINIDYELDDLLELVLVALDSTDLELVEAGPPTIVDLGGVQHLSTTVTVTTP
jgi:hypothetical protein